MSLKLNKSDYKKILDYYKEPIPKTVTQIKKKANEILSLKLCSCIKKVSPDNEPKAIGICTEAVFTRKHLKRGTFKCKKGRKVSYGKTRKNILDKPLQKK
jgi:hypothetical protein